MVHRRVTEGYVERADAAGGVVLQELSGVPEGILALEALGTVTAGDYERVFAPLIDRARRTGSRLRLLYEFGAGFERITPGALWADSRLGFSYVRLLDGCAVVSDIEWIREPARGIQPWLPCPMRVYHNNERGDAIAWLRSLPGVAEVSAADMAKAYLGGVGGALTGLGKLVISMGAKNRHSD